jgi:AcrR family transcriptional regulator
MTDHLNHRRTLVETTMRLVADSGWQSLTFATIAAESGLSLSQIRHLAPMKSALICCLNDEIDATVLRAITEDAFGEETPRERLLEVLLQRFDALKPYKPGLKRLANDLRYDPALGTLLTMLLPRSLAWMLEAARIPLSGWSAPLKVAGLTGLYLRAMRVWLTDDSEDGSKTMAELDRLLKEAERYAKRFA